MKKNLLLLSMPNSGSDWFAEIIFSSNPELSYFREFFNPVTNPKYTDILSQEFGCELVSNYTNIARFNPQNCLEIYQKSWLQENYTFTKENYCVFKIPFLIEHFSCFALIRKVENSLPATRKEQVINFYDAIYNALLDNYDSLNKATQQKLDYCKNLEYIKKIFYTFEIYQQLLVKKCHEYNIPIIQYENLMDSEEIVEHELKKLKLELNLTAMRNQIIKKRKFSPRNFTTTGLGGLASQILFI